MLEGVEDVYILCGGWWRKGGGWRLSLVKLISDSSRYRSAQFRDSSTEMGGAKWMGILVKDKMLGGLGLGG